MPSERKDSWTFPGGKENLLVYEHPVPVLLFKFAYVTDILSVYLSILGRLLLISVHAVLTDYPHSLDYIYTILPNVLARFPLHTHEL